MHQFLSAAPHFFACFVELIHLIGVLQLLTNCVYTLWPFGIDPIQSQRSNVYSFFFPHCCYISKWRRKRLVQKRTQIDISKVYGLLFVNKDDSACVLCYIYWKWDSVHAYAVNQFVEVSRFCIQMKVIRREWSFDYKRKNKIGTTVNLCVDQNLQ